LEFVSKSGWITNDMIGIVGLSIGGGATINAASWDARVKSVITVGAMSHPIDVMKLEFQKRNIPDFIPWLLFGYIQLRFGINFNNIAPVNQIPKTNADILLIHGDEDETIQLAQGQMLAMAGVPEKCRLWVIPGMGHNNCNTYPQFWEQIITFMRETTWIEAHHHK